MKETVALDITDPVILSTIAQTAVLTLTLIIFTLSFRRPNKANREAAYQKVLDDDTDTIRMLIDKPELSRFPAEIAREAASSSQTVSRSPEEMTIRNYILLH